MKMYLVRTLMIAILATGPAPSYGQTSLGGSVPTGSISLQPLPLSLSDAVDRGLRYNLATLSGTQDERVAAAARLKALNELYPKLSADFLSSQQQINLAAFGFTGFPGQKLIIGPFALVDARAHLTQKVVDWKLIRDFRQEQETQKAASFGNENTRELVVLTVANLYLQTIAGTSRVSAVEAQVARAQTLYNRAVDLKNAGLTPSLDVVRAQVELQTEQQRLVAFRNDFALQKLNLARAIGIPLGQEINLTDRMPSETGGPPEIEVALSTAFEDRADLKRSESLLRAAQYAIDSARAERLPTIEFAADYGVIGPRPTSSHGTYSMAGRLSVPLFNSNHSQTDLQAASARYEQRRLEAEDLRGRIEMDVRAAFLEMRSSEEQVRVAQSSLDLAHQQLDQAEDRFRAGVAGNLDVVQAQEAIALADENLISSLYTLNVAKASLARAMGIAEQSIKTFFGGK